MSHYYPRGYFEVFVLYITMLIINTSLSVGKLYSLSRSYTCPSAETKTVAKISDGRGRGRCRRPVRGEKTYCGAHDFRKSRRAVRIEIWPGDTRALEQLFVQPVYQNTRRDLLFSDEFFIIIIMYYKL